MPYNVRLKKYKNGTFQLTYYHRAIRTKDDYWRPYNLPDLHTTDYDEDEEEFDIDKWIELKQSSPFDMSYDPLQVTEIGSEVDDEVDEAIDLEEEYICLIVFYFVVCIISSLDTLYGMKLFGKVEGDLLFLFSVDVFVLIYFVLEDHGVWESVSVYVSQLLS